MKTYIYSGPPSGVTIEGREVMLWPGRPVELPEESGYVSALVAQGRLTPAPATAPQKKRSKGE